MDSQQIPCFIEHPLRAEANPALDITRVVSIRKRDIETNHRGSPSSYPIIEFITENGIKIVWEFSRHKVHMEERDNAYMRLVEGKY